MGAAEIERFQSRPDDGVFHGSRLSVDADREKSPVRPILQSIVVRLVNRDMDGLKGVFRSCGIEIRSFFLCLAHVLIGEPASTSPEHALSLDLGDI
jgi:hypothetical protein